MHAVLFDFNGTLYDDKRFHQTAWQRYLKQRFGMEITPEQVEARLIGPSNRMVFTEILQLDLTEDEIHRCSEEKEAVYRAVACERPENLRLVKGVPELLDLLTDQGIPFALATASVPGNISFYLATLGLGKWLDRDLIVHEDGSGRPSKPDPAYYIEAAARIGAPLSRCIIVEDSRAGLEAARRAKPARLIAIDTMLSEDELQKEPGIYAVIHDFTDFARFLEA